MAWAWAELFSYIATILGFLVAMFAGVIALRPYIYNTRAAANAQMHGLFRDYLRLRFDYLSGNTTVKSAAGNLSETPHSQLVGLKLYALEEMYAWTRREEKYLRSWLGFPTKKT
jgi:hypothetical protein